MKNSLTILNLRLALIYRNSSMRFLAIIICLVFILLFGSLNIAESNRLRMKVGYMDLSDTSFSKEVLQNIHGNELLILEELKYNEGMNKVKKGEVEALFIMPEDIEERALKGETKGLIQFIYLSENSLAPMIGEIILGELLEQISIVTAVNYFDIALEGRMGKDDLLEKAYFYGQDLSKDKKSNYYVTVDLSSLELNKDLSIDRFDDSLIYKQMILGIMLVFLAFFIAFTSINIVKENENKMNERIKITSLTKSERLIGDFLSICCPSILLSLPFVLLLSSNHSNPTYGFFAFFAVLLLYILSFSSIILLLSKCAKTISSYVILSAVMILVMGIISGCFFNIDLTNRLIKGFAYLTPSYHALKALLNILI